MARISLKEEKVSPILPAGAAVGNRITPPTPLFVAAGRGLRGGRGRLTGRES
jgi:hypothetical protein